MRPIALTTLTPLAVGCVLGGGGGHPAVVGGDFEDVDRHAPPPHDGGGNDVQRLSRCCPD